ncbi:MAG: DUF2142 domain-containing protein [Treponemataceae bacterium]|nr:DUF2142 domain-containing protein [Treponemataceae bacterium]
MNKIQNCFNKIPKTAWIFTAFFAVFAFFYVQKFVQFSTNSKFYSTAEDLSACKTVQLTTAEDAVFFTIEPHNNIWQGITLFYDVLDAEKHAGIAITIEDENGNTVYSHRAYAGEFDKDKNYFRFSFANAIKAKRGSFKVNVYGTNICLKCNAETEMPVYKLYGNILKKFLIPAIFVFYCAIFACILLILYFIYVKNLKVETLFLIGATIFGLFFMLALPPLTVADECRHYDSAYAMSNHILGIKETVQGKITKRVCDTLIVPPDFMKNENWTKFNYYEEIWPYALKNMKNRDTSLTNVFGYSFIGSGYPFLYLLSGLGITFGRLLHLNGVFTFLLGRFCNLLFFILVIYFALKKYKENNVFFASIALFPMFLHQIASYSYDSVMLTLALYFVIAISSLVVQKRKITICEIVLFCVAAIAFAPSKAVYFPILFLFFMLSKEQFKTKNGKILFVAGILCCIIAGFAMHKGYTKFGYIVSENEVSLQVANAEIASKIAAVIEKNTTMEIGGFKWIFSHPVKFVYMVLFSLVERGIYYFETYFGAYLGWEAIPMNKILVYSLAALLIFQLSYKKQNAGGTERSNAQRIFSAAIFVFIFFSIFVAFSATNDIDLLHPVLGAIQGRYFLPIVPLLYLTKQFVAEPAEKIEEYGKNIFGFQFFVLILFAFDLIYRIIGIF